MLVKLKDIALVVGGATPSTTNPDYYNGNIIWITPKDLAQNKGSKYIYKGERNISELGFSKSNTYKIPTNNILISTRAPIGYIAINKVECCTNQGFKTLICDNKKVNVDFLYYLLNTKMKSIENLGTGTTFKEVSKESIENFEINLPSLEEQNKIAKILSNIDDQIERNNTMVKRLQDLAQTTYSRWFNQFEFPNEEGKPYKSSGGKLVYNEELKKEIPIDWDFTHLEKLIKENPKSTIKAGEANNGEYPFFNSGESILRYSTPIIKGKNCFLNTGGTAGVKYFTKECSYSTDTWCITSLENYEEYLYLYLSSIIAIINNSYFAGSGLKHLQKSTFKEIKLLYPNIKIMQKFSNIISPIYDKISNNYFENQKLNILKNQLLPLLINGQLI